MKEVLALAAACARRLSPREEELLGLLDGDGGGSDRELSFSDIVEAGARSPSADLGSPAAPRDDRPTTAAAARSSSPGRHEAAAVSKQQRQQAARQRARRSGGGGRGSYGGGGDGVLLNFYVPGLLTRSMTMPKPSRGPPSPGAVQGSPAKPVAITARKASRMQTALGIGCFPALWGRGRRPAKACS